VQDRASETHVSMGKRYFAGLLARRDVCRTDSYPDTRGPNFVDLGAGLSPITRHVLVKTGVSCRWSLCSISFIAIAADLRFLLMTFGTDFVKISWLFTLWLWPMGKFRRRMTRDLRVFVYYRPLCADRKRHCRAKSLFRIVINMCKC